MKASVARQERSMARSFRRRAWIGSSGPSIACLASGRLCTERRRKSSNAPHILPRRSNPSHSCRPENTNAATGMTWCETRSTWWLPSSQIGQVLYHGRDGHATKPTWHGRRAREWLGSLAITSEPRHTAQSGHHVSLGDHAQDSFVG